MVRKSNLDDPEYAAFAWARYWRLMRGMALVTVACVVIALGLIYAEFGLVSIHLYIAAAGGVSVAMLLMAALMGLVFMSSGTGHDEAVEDPVSEEWNQDD